ncbi:NADPH oxidase activator 1 [Protobothrops mucrosquamatus]|uniref:NADPH oxidase activator 1 n=1 Tax=Protobothrops mucrosquamatus TaxID=103944 RepID=UPI000775CEE1|nr:NADPH oxidase activator 1 [Protobothrops mucrosquamatus]
MAYQELVRDWNQGVLALEKGNLATALDIFQGIKNPPSKIDFNVGCLHLLQGNLDQALEAFDQSLSKDNCLAVGFFQRGYVHLQLGRYEEALKDGKLALRCLRNNSCINYKPLGLAFVLRASEVLHNTAATHCRLGRWPEARETLEEAATQMPERETVAALKQVEDRLLLDPKSVPPGKIFRPPLQAKELKEKDYLGQSKKIFQGNAEPPPEMTPPSLLHENQKIWRPGEREENETDSKRLECLQEGEEERADRAVLYRMVGKCSYTSDAPEDLNFKDGDVLEVLSEVNAEWLEGRCSGRTGIFPKLFAEFEYPGATRL